MAQRAEWVVCAPLTRLFALVRAYVSLEEGLLSDSLHRGIFCRVSPGLPCTRYFSPHLSTGPTPRSSGGPTGFEGHPSLPRCCPVLSSGTGENLSLVPLGSLRGACSCRCPRPCDAPRVLGWTEPAIGGACSPATGIRIKPPSPGNKNVSLFSFPPRLLPY